MLINISVNESSDYINRRTNNVESNEIHSRSCRNISHLIEESLKQTDQYILKMKTNLIQLKHSNEINNNTFTQTSNIQIQYIEKSNQNTNLNKSDEMNSFVHRYQITNPTKNLFYFNPNVSFQYFQEYFNRLLEQYYKSNQIYDHYKSKIHCLSLSQQIKEFFKQICQRYKIIVQIYIEQHLDQSILIVSRSLWDQNKDHFLQHQLLKNNIFIIITTFFIYKE